MDIKEIVDKGYTCEGGKGCETPKWAGQEKEMREWLDRTDAETRNEVDREASSTLRHPHEATCDDLFGKGCTQDTRDYFDAWSAKHVKEMLVRSKLKVKKI